MIIKKEDIIAYRDKNDAIFCLDCVPDDTDLSALTECDLGDGYGKLIVCNNCRATICEIIYLHNFIMEGVLERKLKPDEIVIHKNGDTLDNRKENLELITKSEYKKRFGNKKIYDNQFVYSINKPNH